MANESYRALPPGEARPGIVAELAGETTPVLAWRNVVGGQTWRIGAAFLKWSPDAAGIDLRLEAERLRWLDGRHPAPRLLDEGRDDEGGWLVTEAIDAASAVDDRWLAEPATAVQAIATGLRRMHALPVDEVPRTWDSWVARTPPALGARPAPLDPVVVHGDACAPNALLDASGRFAAHVDVGAVAVGDRWADLAIAARSLGWNYGPGWEPAFFDAYGIAPDPARAAYYCALSDAES